ncbi:MAG: nucleotidyltransferase family protein [Candidatus Thorarchaeota archaeon]|nr:nucleotidyltransferase family protein [Candidatus Thorarchaeota archaeon]
MTLQIELPEKETLARFCRKHHIRKFSTFGSALREDFGPDSDLDILVEFKSGHKPGFFLLIEIENELTNLFGRKVDLRTPEDLSRYFREDVMAQAEVYYSE